MLHRLQSTLFAMVLTLSLVSLAGAQNTISGTVIDATTGNTIEGATVTLGAALATTTDASGHYTFTGVPTSKVLADFEFDPSQGDAPLSVNFTSSVEIETYQLTVSKDGYISQVDNDVIMTNGEDKTMNISLSPVLNEGSLRFVLHWGTTESDLDFHLYTPQIDGSNYIVYYGNQGSLLSAPFASLDLDDTSFEGPETITIGQLITGTYTLYVNNFSQNYPIGESGAYVLIYQGSQQITRININTSGTDKYWIVGTIDGDSGVFSEVNGFSPTDPAGLYKMAPKTSFSLAELTPSYIWTFGDGDMSGDANPMYEYLNPGLYSVSLTVNTSPYFDDAVVVKPDIIDVFSGNSVSEIEPNEYSSQGQELTIGVTANGSIGFDNDGNDWYAISIPEDGSFNVEVTKSSGLASRLAFYHNNGGYTGSLLKEGSGTSDSFGGTDVITFPDIAAGTYYIHIYMDNIGGVFPGGSGTYQIATSFEPTGILAEYESNDYPSQAIPLDLNAGTSGHIGYWGATAIDREDWYAIDVLEDGHLKVQIDKSATLASSLYLYHNNGGYSGTLIKEGTANSDKLGGSDVIEMYDLVAGTYFIQVFLQTDSYANNISGYGTYELTTYFESTGIENDVEPNDYPSQAQIINTTDIKTGHIGYWGATAQDREDWYAVSIPEDGALQITVMKGLTLSSKVFLYQNNGGYSGSLVKEGNTNETQFGGPTLVEVPNLSAGEYLIQIYLQTDSYAQNISGFGTYELSMMYLPTGVPADFEPNDYTTQAQMVFMNQKTSGHIGYFGSAPIDVVDWFKFTNETSGDVTIQVNKDMNLASKWSLFEANGDYNGALITSGTAQPTDFGGSDMVSVPALPAGDYYVQIYLEMSPMAQYLGGFGTYELMLSTGGVVSDYIESTMEGGLWSETTTWINGVVPQYGDNVIIHGDVQLDYTTEVNELIVDYPARLYNNHPNGEVVDLMVVGNLTNNGYIFTTMEYGGFSFNVIGNIMNNGVIATNTFNLHGSGEHANQVLSGHGQIGYTDNNNLPTGLLGLVTSISKYEGMVIVNGITNFSSVSIDEYFMGFDLSAPGEYSTNEIGFTNNNDQNMYSIVNAQQIIGGRVFADGNALFFRTQFQDVSLDGMILVAEHIALNGSTNNYAHIIGVDVLSSPAKLAKVQPNVTMPALRDLGLEINGVIHNYGQIFNAGISEMQFNAYVFGDIYNHNRWATDFTFMVANGDQSVSSDQQPDFIGFASNLAIPANVVDATTWQWFFWPYENDKERLEGEVNEYIYGEPPYEEAYGAVICSTNVGWSRKVNLYLNDKINSDLMAGFETNIQNGSAPLYVEFYDRSYGNPTSWYWEFGDGESSNEQNPTHTYVNPGMYTVSLTIWNGDLQDRVEYMNFIQVFGEGDYGVLTGQITDAVTGLPVPFAWVEIGWMSTTTDENGYYRIENIPPAGMHVDFWADQNYGMAPLGVQFYSSVLDGTYPFYVSVTGYNYYYYNHVMIIPGQETVFNVSLSPLLTSATMRFVLNWNAAPTDLDAHLQTPQFSNGNSYHVYYAESGNMEAEPFAQLDHDVTNGYGPETITIKELTSGLYHFYIYNFSGDVPINESGAVVQVYNENGILQTIEAPKEGNGLYWYVGTIDGENQNFTLINTIQTTEPGSPLMKSVRIPKVQPLATEAEPVISYYWEFGDGNSSTEMNPFHMYTNPGFYSVRLVVNNGVQQAEMYYQDYIRVADPSNSVLAVNDTVTVIAGQAIRINMLDNDYLPNNGYYNSWFMNIESAQLGMLIPSMDNRFAMYIASADVSGIEEFRYGIANEYSYSEASIFVRVIPGIVVSNTPPVVMLPLELSILEDSSIVFPARKVIFDDRTDFNDLLIEFGTSSTNVQVNYNAETGQVAITSLPNFWGTARVGVKATDEQGLYRIDSMLVTFIPVNDMPFAQVTVSSGELVEGGMKFTFTDESTDNLDPEGGIVSWLWDFGDGESSTEQNPEHIFKANGMYTVTLTVTDNAGATAVAEEDVEIVITSNESNMVYTLALHGNYPNPFNPTTTIRFEVPETGNVELSVYNTLGQKVATVLNKTMYTGLYSVPFDASKLSSGTYLYVMRYQNKQLVGRMTLVK